MTDRPMIFSGPMVCAILNGDKSVTRRIMKPQPYQHPTRPDWGIGVYNKYDYWIEVGGMLPPWHPGDRLWVRETCATGEGKCRDVVYRAGMIQADWNAVRHDASFAPWKVRASIHMPRWASRLTLVVTDVRPERVQDISEADAVAEGIQPHGHAFTGYGKESDLWMTARNSFKSLWNTLHGPDAWERNDWVWRIEFTVRACNIDSMEDAA